MRPLRRRGALALALVFLLASGAASSRDEDADEPAWQEEQAVLPDFPRDEDLLPFDVGGGGAHRYFVDARSLAVGGDQVVRFTLVVRTGGGSSNISFEGIRCDTLEHRLYATGRPDGKWAKARISQWKRIEKRLNGYHAALSRDYFCPASYRIRTAEEGVDALKRGRHPDAN